MQLVCFITLTVFQIFEYAEIKFNGISNYFSDWFNYFDATQFLFYIANIILTYYLLENPSYGFYKLLS